MATAQGNHRNIAWNGISLSLAGDCHGVVSGKRHLIVEENFQTLIDLRWQPADAQNHRKLVALSLRQYGKIDNSSPVELTLPGSWNHFSSFTEITAYGSAKKTEWPQLLFASCSACGQFLLLHFPQTGDSPHVLERIGDLRCSCASDGPVSWTVQDFTVAVPRYFDLTEHSFKAGATYLKFTQKKKTVSLCRFSSASMRLQQTGLPEMLSRILGENINEGALETGASEASYMRTPSIGRQVIHRLRRQLPFLRATLRHDQEHDRLLAVVLGDIRPLDEDEFQHIRESFEIVHL